MNDKFDELAKGLAQSVTRRGALKKFGVGLAGIALACFGLANKAEAAPKSYVCNCQHPYQGCLKRYPNDVTNCAAYCGELCRLKNGGGY